MSDFKHDANLDPISGEPGSHPIGTTLGAAAGGIAAAAALGSLVAGPIGTVIGSAVGVIAGGLAGHAVAEQIDPTVLDAHWRSRFDSEPYYEAGATYDDYAPAYRLGAHYGTVHPNTAFDDHEPLLAQDYAQIKGPSRLDWDQAKEAARAAWAHAVWQNRS
jgi:hypothetical protein